MHISLSNKNLTKLPDNLPKHISGHFYCSYTKLTSLEGAPQSVGSDFNCSNNILRSLEGAPQHVVGDFYCHNNPLTSLEGLPQSVGGVFSCDKYLLKDKENRYIIIGSLIRGRLKKYEGKELYNICLNVIEELTGYL